MRRRFINSNKTFDYSNYMTIEVLEDGYEVYFARDVEYNLNGNKWMILKAGLRSPILNKGDLLSLRCSLTPSEKFGRFNDNGKAINLRGNILSLIFKDDINLDISHYCDVFSYAFSYNNIVSVEKNFLPATTLAEGCYSNMFDGCSSLTTAPELPATTLAVQCYDNMFYNCTSLTTAPKLPATTLANSCYYMMFSYCTSLTTAPELPATTLAKDCYDHMFSYCTSLTTAPELPATTLVNKCYAGMFRQCSSLTTAPTLPVTTLANYCYSDMFRGCPKLNYIKMLATDISAPYCLDYWVSNVASTGTFVKHPNMTSLPTGNSGIPFGWTVINDSSGSSATDNYLTIYALEDGLTASLSDNACEYCIDGDSNWLSLAAGATTQSVNAGHTLSFRGNLTPNSSNGIGTFTISKKCNLEGNCMSMLFGDNAANNRSLYGKNNAFRKLFHNCTNIVRVSENFLPATTLAESCYFYMFYGCSSLTTAPALPATTLARYCYSRMFQACTNLTTAPDLPATTLTEGCYNIMFYGCSKLKYIKMLATNISASYCLTKWADGVASTGTFVKNPSMSSLPTGVNGKPSGWTVVNDGED